MKTTTKSYFLLFLSLLLSSCEESKTELNKSVQPSIFTKGAGTTLETQSDEEEARQKAARLYEALTGTNLLDGNPLKIDVEKLVGQGRMKEAAGKITHRYNGSKNFYNNVVKAFALPINRTHSIDNSVTDITALFVGVVRDDLSIDDLLFGNFYYRDSSINSSAGQPTQRDYPNIYPNGNNQLGHYDYMDLRGNLRDELLKETKGSGDVGVFTTNEWARSYYEAGTNRRPWKGIVEHFFCQDHPNIKTIYIPDDFVRRDVPRSEAGVPEAFQQNCKGCHAQMDPISTAFQMFDYNVDNMTIVKRDTFQEKINNPENFPSGYTPLNDDWWIYTADSQENLLGFRDVAADQNGPAVSFTTVGSGLRLATGRGLKDLARTIAFSKGFAQCLAQRIVLQLVHHKVWSLATLDEKDKLKLEGDKELVDQIANELLTTRKLRRAFELVAIKYAERP